MSPELLQSKAFDFLRFPLIVGVIFVHLSMGYEGEQMGNVANFFYQLFSNGLGRVSVPLFFFISGYLFFYKTNFCVSIYPKKLKNRIRTLLIPYLFWITLSLIITFVLKKLGISAGTSISTSNFLTAFWTPYPYHLWFIRDLMVCSLLTPAIYIIIKKTSYYLPIILGILWYLSLSKGLSGLSYAACFFFSFGAYCSIRKLNVIGQVRRIGWWIYILYMLLLISDALCKEEAYSLYIHKMGILAGFCCCFKLAAFIISRKEFRCTPLLASSSFFVYLIHAPWMTMLECKLIGQFTPHNECLLIIHYFFNAFFVALSSLFIYIILRRYIPKITAIITGGRA